MIRFFVLICCFLLLLPHSSQATEPSPLHVKGTYYFTWNHIPLAKLWIAAQQSDTDYQFTASLKSKAIVSLFRKVKALTTSQGIYRDGVWQALTYHNEAHYSDETKTVDLSFAKSGKLLERTLSHDDDPNYRPVVAKDALKGVVTYGNALFVLRQSIHDALTSEQTEFIHYLYDGKRLMEITASITKNVPFEINKQPMTAYKVALKRHLVDGFTHKEKEKAKEGEPLAYLYFSNDNRLLPIGMEIEREALKKESDDASKERLQKLDGTIAELEEQSSALTEKWQSEKARLAGSSKLKEQLDEARMDLERAQRDGDLSRAGELAYGIIPQLEKQIAAADNSGGMTSENQLVKEVVTAEEIAQVVSRWTGIPVDKMLEGEREKLLAMESLLDAKVIGQPQAVAAVSDAVRRSRAGLQDPTRPIGSFLFLGPTGVGKTELTKALAEFLFDDPQAMLRIDMSEFMEKHAVARLVGAPPGYVGYEEGGVLTESVRRRPYQVILFDEVEKAHPDVFNILLQVLDDGRLTDGQGRTVDFSNTLIILTSNLGAQHIAALKDGESVEKARDSVMEVVRSAFRPEFLNRLDEILLFSRLSREDMSAIVALQIKDLEKLLQARHITLELDDASIQWLADQGYDPVYGARPLKRVIQKKLQDPLATKLLSGDVNDGDHVVVTAHDLGLDIAAKH